MTPRYEEVEVHIYQLNNYRRDHWGVYSGAPITDPARFHLAHTSRRMQRSGCSAHEVLESLWADIHTWSRFHADIALQYMGVDLFASDVVVVRNVAYLRKAEGWQRLDWDEFLARTSPPKDRLIKVG